MLLVEKRRGLQAEDGQETRWVHVAPQQAAGLDQRADDAGVVSELGLGGLCGARPTRAPQPTHGAGQPEDVHGVGGVEQEGEAHRVLHAVLPTAPALEGPRQALEDVAGQGEEAVGVPPGVPGQRGVHLMRTVRGLLGRGSEVFELLPRHGRRDVQPLLAGQPRRAHGVGAPPAQQEVAPLRGRPLAPHPVPEADEGRPHLQPLLVRRRPRRPRQRAQPGPVR
mmetsp:Transcript_37375/g.105530  ORF Transcript_37375/g.105530 Transcript_37375/m.105530 type:complete len:223 (-) Transcript_37375:354-1022(-)